MYLVIDRNFLKPRFLGFPWGSLLDQFFDEFFDLYDLFIGSTETKYIELNTKTQNIFCCVNENLMTFLYTLTGGTRKQKENFFFLS